MIGSVAEVKEVLYRNIQYIRNIKQFLERDGSRHIRRFQIAYVGSAQIDRLSEVLLCDALQLSVISDCQPELLILIEPLFGQGCVLLLSGLPDYGWTARNYGSGRRRSLLLQTSPAPERIRHWPDPEIRLL